VPSALHGRGSRWRARYVDADGREHAKQFPIKAAAQRWLDQQTSTIVAGRHVAPRDAKITVGQWCETWLDGYKGNRPNSVSSAPTMVRMIVREFGDSPLCDVRPSRVKAWCARLKTGGYAVSTISRAHSLLKQIFEDAVFDGLLVAILLGAFAGLRIGEACGLRVADVDFMRGIVHPKQQWNGAPLKTAACDAAIPIPQDLALLLAASVKKLPSDMLVTSEGTGQ
jgi:integrase